MKRMLSIFVLGLILFSSGMSLVSAATGPVDVIQGVVSGAYELVRPVLEGIIGDTDTAEFFLAKILFLVIIFAIIYKSLEKIPFFSSSNTKWVLWVVSISVSILSIRWFGDSEIIRTVILPYSALGIAITAGIPFVVWFTITEFSNMLRIYRKISWIFFIVIFTSLSLMRRDAGFSYIYSITAILGFIAMMTDAQIQRLKHAAKLEKTRTYANKTLLDKLRDKLKDADDRYSRGDIDHEEFEKRVRELKIKINHLSVK